MKHLHSFLPLFIIVTLIFIGTSRADSNSTLVRQWKNEWSQTDFTRSNINFSEIISGGPAKDGIPAIDKTKFRLAKDIQDIDENEPVIAVEVNGVHKAYPLRVLIWHEIANDMIDDTPVAVTYCPLCNAAVVFDRRVDGRLLDFGVSGKLRHSDMIMYDRQTESWWQQFTGQGIVGAMTDAQLKFLPSQTIPFGRFRENYPEGMVMIPNNGLLRDYGRNPYVNYDSGKGQPFLFRGDYNGPVPALAYVVAVGKNAWPLEDLRQQGSIEHLQLKLVWNTGMNAALDSARINKGRDIGFVEVYHKHPDGDFIKAVHDVTFAFAFKAFYPDGIIHTNK